MNDPLNEPQEEGAILVGGVPVPLSMAAEAVSRCILAIQITERLIAQGFASEEDLIALRAGLTGEDKDEAAAEGVIE